MKLMNIRNNKGFAMMSVYLAAGVTMALSSATMMRALYEARNVEREINHQQSVALAEAGLQTALVQVGTSNFGGVASPVAYSGYIDETDVGATNFSDVGGTNLGSFQYSVDNPGQADWVVVRATGTSAVDGTLTTVEGRVYLDSNFSKFMVYANTPTVWLGNNLNLGSSNGVDPEGVPANGADRNMLYYTGDLDFSGTGVDIYGDVHTQGDIAGNISSTIHGDTYSAGYQTSGGMVTNSGVSGGLTVGDGFSDDIDRNGDGFINSSDYPDHHDHSVSGGGDSKKFETVHPIDLNFYANVATSTPGSNGIDVKKYTGAANRYLKFETGPGGTTKIVEYDGPDFGNSTGSYTLAKNNGIVYVDGNLYTQGEIKGRVTVVSSKNVYYTDHLKYSGGASYVDPSNPNVAAVFAKNQHYFLPNDIEVSGILYGEKALSPMSNLALVAAKKFDDEYNVVSISGGEKADGHFRHYGNIVMNGTADTSVYTNDRAYLYDENLKYYRPPGIPIQPVLRVVRETV